MDEQQDKTYFDVMKSEGSFDIQTVDENVNLDDSRRFKKMELASDYKMQLSALTQQLPSVIGAGILSKSNLYVMKFPKGLPHTVMHLNRGGVSTTIVDANGRIKGTSSLYSVSNPASVIIGAMSVMSAISGQYFLAQINNEIRMVNQGLDKILNFLYGDKKAELVSEISFIKYAHQNYNSIIGNKHQTTATIASIQEARKVAMKDVQFYLNDLDSTIKPESKDDIGETVRKSIQIKKCLELSMQLYLMSNVLEVYYSQNYDSDYIKYIENDVTEYLKMCNSAIFACFNRLNGQLDKVKGKPIGKKIDISELRRIIEENVNMNDKSGDSETYRSIHEVLKSPTEQQEYYLKDGELYLKTSM